MNRNKRRPRNDSAVSMPIVGDLESLLGEVKKHRESEVAKNVLVDISEFTGSKRILEWHAPSVVEVYRIGSDAEILLRENPLWNNLLAVDVATLAACHSAPMPTGEVNIAAFYGAIANDPDQQALYYALITRMQKEFPLLKGTNKDQLLIVDLCSQYYHRHPEECGHLPGHIVAELQRIHEAKKMTSNII